MVSTSYKGDLLQAIKDAKAALEAGAELTREEAVAARKDLEEALAAAEAFNVKRECRQQHDVVHKHEEVDNDDEHEIPAPELFRFFHFKYLPEKIKKQRAADNRNYAVSYSLCCIYCIRSCRQKSKDKLTKSPRKRNHFIYRFMNPSNFSA